MKSVAVKTISLKNGETLGYRVREGGSEPILLIHGNMISSKHWDLVLEALPEQFKVYALDLRGTGLSTKHQSIETIKDFSDDIKLFVDEVGLKRFSLCGWSAGGPVCMQFTTDYPEYVKKLILLASASTRGFPFMTINSLGNKVRLKTKEEVEKESTKSIPILNAYKNKDKEFLRRLWNVLIYTEKKPEEAHYDEYLEDMLTVRSLTDIYQALNLFNISDYHNGLTEGTNQAKNIYAPTLVLLGERDLVVSRAMTEEIIADIGENAKLVYLKNCGHSPLIDDLDQFVTIVTNFLNE